MSEFEKISTLQDLNVQDEADLLAGYRAGLDNAQEPGSDKSRSFWHGWRNGRVDGGHVRIDADQEKLAKLYVAAQRAH